MTNQVISAAGKLKRIREAFVKQLPTQVQAIQAAYVKVVQSDCDPGEIEAFHRCLHTIKGACATFGLKPVSNVAACGELLAKEVLDANASPDTLWHQKIQHCLTDLAKEISVIDLSQSLDTRGIELVTVASGDNEREQKLIYICEDDSYQRVSLTTQIECFGYKVIAFGDLGQLKNAVINSQPDALIMDMMFPGNAIGGAEAVQELQKKGREMPVIFISSHSDFNNRLAAVRAGSSAYFVKPVTITEICSSLDSLTHAVTPDPYRVLIVDDDPHLSELYSTLLQSAGMSTMMVNDPLQVLEPLLDFKPDLVLTDMYMPGCNGMELAKIIRQIGSSFSIPIIYLSSETDLGKQFQAMRTGGDEFLTKPISPENLIAAVAGRAGRMKTIRSFMVRDSMTGLYNHSTTKEMLESSMIQARRSGTEVCFAMIDVDKFKSVNDTYGHQMGDQVLITLAHLLQQRLRKSDIVGRYGGEEFAAVLYDCPLHRAVQLIDELRANFSALKFPVGDSSFSSSFSAGVASLSQFGDVESICKAADTALYAAKEGGRNRVIEAETVQ